MGFTENYSTDEPARGQVDSWKGLVLLEFGVDWCPHCQAVQPELKRLLAEHPEVRHVKVEDGQGRPLGRSFRVKLWPNLVLMKDGEVLQQLARPSAAELQTLLAGV